MIDNVFVDTNILVYARDRGAGEKQTKAERLILEIWKNRNGRISVQVLNEYFVTVTQKLKPGMAHKEAWADIVALSAWGPVAIDWKLMEQGRDIQNTHKTSWWDSLIVAAAQSSNCKVLYSEDMTHGAVIGETKIINPFI